MHQKGQNYFIRILCMWAKCLLIHYSSGYFLCQLFLPSKIFTILVMDILYCLMSLYVSSIKIKIKQQLTKNSPNLKFEMEETSKCDIFSLTIFWYENDVFKLKLPFLIYFLLWTSSQSTINSLFSRGNSTSFWNNAISICKIDIFLLS